MDLLAGRLQVAFETLPTTSAYVKQGKLKALATTSPKRLAEFPDVPTMREVGMPDYKLRTWYGSPTYFVLGAVHAVVFWVTVSMLTPFVLLVCLFNERRRCLHDILVGTVVINNPSRAQVLRPPRRGG